MNEKLKIMTSNVHGMAGYGDYKIPVKLISEMILDCRPDLIALTEFYEAEGYSDLELFLGKYNYLSYTTKFKEKENGVLIAVDREKVFADSISVNYAIRNTNGVLPNFLEVSMKLRLSGKKLHFIGTRIVDNKTTNKKQFISLKHHIESLGKEAAIFCAGDFNAWGSYLVNKDKWDLKPHNCELYSPGLYIDNNGVYRNTYINNQLAEWSFVQANGARTPLDHIFVSENCSCLYTKYYWGFVNRTNGYGNRTGEDYLSDLIGLPDHAVLLGEVEI